MSDVRLVLRGARLYIGNFEVPREFACPCCGQLNISRRVLDAAQRLRSLVMGPLIVNSGYRCKSHNVEVGGSPRSDHPRGLAFDVKCEHLEFGKFVGAARLLKMEGVIARLGVYEPGPMSGEKGFLHCGVERRGPGAWSYWRYSGDGELTERVAERG